MHRLPDASGDSLCPRKLQIFQSWALRPAAMAGSSWSPPIFKKRTRRPKGETGAKDIGGYRDAPRRRCNGQTQHHIWPASDKVKSSSGVTPIGAAQTLSKHHLIFNINCRFSASTGESCHQMHDFIPYIISTSSYEISVGGSKEQILGFSVMRTAVQFTRQHLHRPIPSSVQADTVTADVCS